MKSSATTAKYVPRVAKLDKNKYVAYVDMHIGPLWEMAVDRSSVCICKKRKAAQKAADKLVAAALHAERHVKKHTKNPVKH